MGSPMLDVRPSHGGAGPHQRAFGEALHGDGRLQWRRPTRGPRDGRPHATSSRWWPPMFGLLVRSARSNEGSPRAGAVQSRTRPFRHLHCGYLRPGLLVALPLRGKGHALLAIAGRPGSGWEAQLVPSAG